MARRRKGRDVTGWLIVDKPSGIGSTDVVTAVRRALDARKAGHAGTLDPDATGVLAIALGEATKIVPWLQDAEKSYRFAVRFGAATATDDAAGEVVATSGRRPSAEEVAAALPAFTGDIEQVPPAYSAVRTEGRRAHMVARGGGVPDLAARPLRVHALALEGMEDESTAILTMTCGKGGYVRAIARDLGAALGGHAHCLWLRRTQSGPFAAQDGIAMDALSDPAAIELLPLEAAIPGMARVTATQAGAVRLAHGNAGEAIASGAAPAYGAEALAMRDGRALAIGAWRGGMLHPSRVFVAPGPAGAAEGSGGPGAT